jgi:hypothetical protein
MWESRRDFQRVWEGWEAGLMAFHAFHTLSFPWPAHRAVKLQKTDVQRFALIATWTIAPLFGQVESDHFRHADF